ncbi:MAG TPA: coenzyme F420-0:L-glutamate ligase [Xanthobacteraceae bacterium]|nr:coenzyme F420-0:L-glutamate ligase [Xanthobacteraceae bacterium]
MIARSLTLTALAGLPLVKPGDDLAALLIAALRCMQIQPQDKDVLVVAQKVVSKAEGRLVDLKTVAPSARALALAKEVNKDARLVEVILSESDEVIRQQRDVLIVAHRLGFIMANAGVDQSNVAGDDEQVLLLPRDPDASAAALKTRLDREFGAGLGIVINDSFGRPWRCGVVGVALGAAGLPVIRNMIDQPDLFGRKLRVTEIAVADEIAAAGSLLMGQGAEGQPAVLLRGLDWDAPATPASVLLRPKQTDLFR